MPEEKEEKKDFVVKDRRIFAEGRQDNEEKEEKETPPVEEKKEERIKEAGEASEAETQEAFQFPEINFATFVASLNASALLHLGAIEDPSSGTKNKNLPLAKQTIDILNMLQEKTVGNLSEEEGSLLKNILYDLRIMYVKEKK
jgi:hypothetical protein